jgi:hypothetical protein
LKLCRRGRSRQSFLFWTFCTYGPSKLIRRTSLSVNMIYRNIKIRMILQMVPLKRTVSLTVENTC